MVHTCIKWCLHKISNRETILYFFGFQISINWMILFQTSNQSEDVSPEKFCSTVSLLQMFFNQFKTVFHQKFVYQLQKLYVTKLILFFTIGGWKKILYNHTPMNRVNRKISAGFNGICIAIHSKLRVRAKNSFSTNRKAKWNRENCLLARML